MTFTPTILYPKATILAESYFVECGCGRSIAVKISDAGSEKTCPSCGSSLLVPASSKLKELSGDRYPHLSPLDKIRTTFKNREPPFEGICHSCSSASADYYVPITFNVLLERHVNDNGGIRPSLAGGVKLVAGAAEEYWQKTTFPLFLCTSCQAIFQSEQSSAKLKNRIKLIGLLGLFAAFIYFAYYNAEIIALLSGLIWFIGMIAWAAKFRQTKKYDHFVISWISKIRWISDILDTEEEFTITVGPTQRFE